MRYPRTEWAAGISRTGLIRALEGIGVGSGVTSAKIAEIEARIAALEALGGADDGGVTPEDLEDRPVELSEDVIWDVGVLEPMQSATETFATVIALSVEDIAIAIPEIQQPYCMISAIVATTGLLTVNVVNVGDAPANLGYGKWTLKTLHNA